MSNTKFQGIPAEGLQFLRNLAKNNNREWFNANKKVFQEQLQEPTLALVEALGEGLKKIAPDIQYGSQANGRGSLFRIYRDVRFAKDKTPYKESQDMIFWEGPGKKAYWSVFFFRIKPGGNGLGSGNHGFDKEALAKYRDAVVDEKLGDQLERILVDLGKDGDALIGTEHYKRVPRGYPSDHRRADLLRYNALTVFIGNISDADLSSPNLVEVCLAQFEKALPLHRWIVKVVGGR